jgi:hypothetical protein
MLSNAELADLANAVASQIPNGDQREDEDTEVFWEESGNEYFD